MTPALLGYVTYCSALHLISPHALLLYIVVTGHCAGRVYMKLPGFVSLPVGQQSACSAVWMQFFAEHTSSALCLAITVLDGRSDTSGSGFAVPLTASASQSNPFSCRIECLNDQKGNYQR